MKAPIRMMALAVILGAAWAPQAMAQGQVVDDKDQGLHFTIPKDWEWRSRDRDVFLDCAPKIESRPGMPGCYATIQKRKIPPGQAAIGDEDRAKWKGWATGNGMRPLVSARDSRIGAFAAYEVVVSEGRNGPSSRRIFMWVPEKGLIDATLYAYWKDEDRMATFEPKFRAVLESLQAR